MILRKFIGWCIVFGSLFIGLRGLDLSAHGAEGIKLTQSRSAQSQLRIDHWAANGWIVEQSDRRIEIRFPGLTRPIDTSAQLFGTLASRIAGISSTVRGTDTVLTLTLRCGCSIAVTGQAGSAVVIDVIDPEPSAGVIASSGAAPRTAPLPVRKYAKAADADADNAPLDVDAARQRLMEQLLKAAEAGLVELRPDPDAPATLRPQGGETITEAMTEGEPDKPPQPSAGTEETDAPGTPEIGDRKPPAAPAELVSDPPVDEGAKKKARNAAVDVVQFTPRCFADEAFSLPDPLTDASFSKQLSALQSDLVGEFDVVNTEKAIELVRFYIATAMTEEARLVMETFVPDHPLRPLYTEIADLLDNKPLATTASLRLPDCGGDQRLWRAMTAALDGDGKAAARDEAAADRALERLPVGLRDVVGSRIGLAAADAGAWDAARRMQAMTARSQSSDYGKSALELLLSARIAEWHGDFEDARSLLKAARAQTGYASDEAVLKLAEADLSEAALGLNTQSLRTDLGAIARFNRGTPQGHRAFELEVQFLDLAEGRDAAIDLLSHGVETGLYPGDAFAGLVSRLVEGTLYNELSRPLALIYLDDPDRYEAALNQTGFRRALIRSLVETGLASAAYGMMRDNDVNDTDLVDLLADALLASRALIEADGLLALMPESPARNQFAARVLLANGQPDQALDRLETAAKDWNASEDTQVDILDIEIAAALAEDDFDKALYAINVRLELRPDATIAEKAGLIALETGAPEIPSKARSVLEKQAPERLADLDLLFSSAAQSEDIADAATANSLIETLESELSLIEDILDDG